MLQNKLACAPKTFGIYQWLDKNGNVIYVGKAKNIYNRIHQYFDKNVSYKTKFLVKEIHDVNFITTKNENDALILEANLINKLKPKYNVLLKENNNYPYIVVTKETNPRLIYTRNQKRFKGTYYGPIASNDNKKYEIFNLLNRIFPLRKCKILPKKKCIYYDIGCCCGPCINKIPSIKYDSILKEINNFFKGNNKKIISELKNKEKLASKNLDFENAAKYRDLIIGIKNIKNLSSSVQIGNKNKIDIIGTYFKNSYIAIEIHTFIDRKLISVFKQIINCYDSYEESVTSFLNQYYLDNKNPPSYIINNFDAKLNTIKTKTPKTGKMKKILQEANKNAKYYYEMNILSHQKHINDTLGAFEELKKLLDIDNLALINVFDMSHMFNKNIVGGMISLTNGQFNKKLYRKFNIDSNIKGDTNQIKDVITRQYKNVINKSESLPNLIIIDGGKNQITAVMEGLRNNNLDTIIPIMGLVKNNKHMTDHILYNNKEIYIEKNSSLFTYLTNIQNEVHRFTISFHKSKK